MRRYGRIGGHWSFIAVLFLGLFCSTGRADYCYNGTEYSLEWLVDASSLIVEGHAGRYSTKKDSYLFLSYGKALKQAKGIAWPATPKVLKRICLGRAVYPDQYQRLPILSEPSTYPSANCPLRIIKETRPNKHWGEGDRCIFFFGKDGRRPFHVINLNRPEPFEDRFLLAADRHGNLIIDPDDLIRRIEQRVARGCKTTSDRSVRVCSDGIQYYAFGTQLDGQSYYGLIVPPDADLEKDLKKAFSSQPKEKEAIWYWFYSGKKADDFRADYWADFEKMVHAARADWHQSNDFRKSRETASSLSETYRNWPHGWRWIISADGQYLAYTDANYLYIYNIENPNPRQAKLIYKTDKNRSQYYEMKFSPEGTSFSYVNTDREPVIVDLRKNKKRQEKAQPD